MNGITRAKNCSGWLFVCVTVLTLCGALMPSGPAWAQTPYSQGRQCNAPGGPSCSPAGPMVTPWLYEPNYSFTPVPAQSFTSVGAVVSWFQGVVEAGAGGYCTADLTGTTPVGSPPNYQDNIEVGFNEFFNLSLTGAKSSNPPFSNQSSGQETVFVARTVHCPFGLNMDYQASPLIGPSCSPPAPPAPSPCPSSNWARLAPAVAGDPRVLIKGPRVHTPVCRQKAGRSTWRSLTNTK
jgi:hypothetical protein